MPYPLSPSDRVPTNESLTPQPSFSLLRQMERLPSERLDGLVEEWLSTLGFHSVRLWERRGTISTYEATYGAAPFAIPARVRIHQRLRRLELPHVESFLGHLVRSGNPLGILVTPGECSWAASLGARTPKLPFLRLCGGAEWADELRAARSGGKPRDPEPFEMKPRPASPAREIPAAHQAPITRSEKRERRGAKVPCETCAGGWRGGYRIW
jgi:hypothetical protein